mmetsp:Transcript_8275/g.17982  ORF Transcript_8275/g.17982 Transcript_8275/m.17982 type:complete len:215 (+) Transcript_8275:858-1502(+)
MGPCHCSLRLNSPPPTTMVALIMCLDVPIMQGHANSVTQHLDDFTPAVSAASKPARWQLMIKTTHLTGTRCRRYCACDATHCSPLAKRASTRHVSGWESPSRGIRAIFAIFTMTRRINRFIIALFAMFAERGKDLALTIATACAATPAFLLKTNITVSPSACKGTVPSATSPCFRAQNPFAALSAATSCTLAASPCTCGDTLTPVLCVRRARTT